MIRVIKLSKLAVLSWENKSKIEFEVFDDIFFLAVLMFQVFVKVSLTKYVLKESVCLQRWKKALWLEKFEINFLV